MSPDSGLLVGLPPILDVRIETLILGSFPSPASLAARQYYAHRQNQFWRLLGALLSQPLADLDYAEKQRVMLSHRIGVWDVYHRCTRQGALDSAIQAADPNDFSRLETSAPCLWRVCFNGKTSGKFERWFREKGYATCILPSTSPAFTLSFERKVELWRESGLNHPAGR